jgi:hypothetical protein
LIGTPQQIIKIKRGGTGQMSGSGPSGKKLKPARVHARAMAEMAAKYRGRKGKTASTTTTKGK